MLKNFGTLGASLRVGAVKNPVFNQFDFYMRIITYSATTKPSCAIAEPIIFREAPEGQMIEPSFSMSVEDCGALMDELWNLGIRPSEESHGRVGELEATKYHLEDMRKIAGMGKGKLK